MPDLYINKSETAKAASANYICATLLGSYQSQSEAFAVSDKTAASFAELIIEALNKQISQVHKVGQKDLVLNVV